MTSALDETHDPHRRSWVGSANGHPDFPIQNLPLGLFSVGDDGPRSGIAIGERILDLSALVAAGLLDGEASALAQVASGTGLNAALALGAVPRQALRRQVSALLSEESPRQSEVAPLLHDASVCRLHLPATIGGYTDFYVGIHHARTVGQQLRPDNPLLPNYKHIPIGYHGRASSIRPSGTPVRRPRGQMKPPEATEPVFGPSRRLDYELEIGVWIGPGNALGEPIPIADAQSHIAGYCLLNDWSARDIQAWEYQPLGPFLAKNFATTISPWIVTPEALAPFRIAQDPRPEGDPAPLPYLVDEADQRHGAFDIRLDVLLLTNGLHASGHGPHRVSTSNARHMYWTVAQMIAHHTSGGCNLAPGDLIGTGTISGPERGASGSLMEAVQGGREPLRLASGEERRFLEDGDEVILRARAVREGFVTIGFGDCRAQIRPALA